ncbi:penicillin-binding transpeptidase domain-containing protein [Sphingobacterium haloxyli]|uniref:beta-lactamase n=1 Tax=Sphingobacterium haloxyli TaxID=2100533 RepID=A0A2S9IVN7_9SPHI|nr:penicillin-binding transpeptidase domain-containing protein [Sphingobacterium haloxyli]PRD44585.1 penicillin binding protein transpeptidase domain-containing protein [Sphingobacterium haloxyli]
MFKRLKVVVVFLSLFSESFAQLDHHDFSELCSIPNAQRYFEDCGVEGTVLVYDTSRDKLFASDVASIYGPSLPASTFKIINSLIALETGIIPDEHYIVKWPGVTDTIKYGYRPDIYNDMTVEEAFRTSAVWVFLELAHRIGKHNYEKYLTLCGYGDPSAIAERSDFWNFGKFELTPFAQLTFLKRLQQGSLPFSKRNMDIVKKIMKTEVSGSYTLFSKTGWTRENGINTGWWVGFIEKEKGAYIFVSRLLQNRKNNRHDFGSCRIAISKAILKELEIID